ncbi:MAG: hypothetical protein MI717_15740 [Spirochaetales bacterium]|nr:hypothetical protein [Spirochaetales bacterium]
MRKKIVFGLLLLTAIGASLFAETGTLTIARSKSVITYLKDMEVVVNQQLDYKLGIGEYFQQDIEAGEYLVQVRFPEDSDIRSCPFLVTVEPGKNSIYVLNCDTFLMKRITSKAVDELNLDSYKPAEECQYLRGASHES